jgi:hypothetical protein
MTTIITVKIYIAMPYSAVRAFTAFLREFPRRGMEMETISTQKEEELTEYLHIYTKQKCILKASAGRELLQLFPLV